MASFTEDQIQRYSRQIILKEIGGKGQRKLLEAKVLVLGAGGLGSPIAIYLALAGVGTIGIVDFDTVDLSNLHRQTLHFNDDVGKPKVESAVETLKAYNPDVNVVAHNEPLTSDNAFGIIGQYDIVVNGADNFPSRYLVNDACYLLKKPLVDGCILMFDAQATVFLPGQGCYRCLYPSPPPPGLVPSCAQAGVLGALPGLVGSLQAIETIKLILGVGEPLVSRMFLYDALAAEFRQVRLRKYPGVPALRRPPDDPRTRRLRGLLRLPRAGGDGALNADRACTGSASPARAMGTTTGTAASRPSPAAPRG